MRKSFKLADGVRLNLSGKAIGLRVGRGAFGKTFKLVERPKKRKSKIHLVQSQKVALRRLSDVLSKEVSSLTDEELLFIRHKTKPFGHWILFVIGVLLIKNPLGWTFLAVGYFFRKRDLNKWNLMNREISEKRNAAKQADSENLNHSRTNT